MAGGWSFLGALGAFIASGFSDAKQNAEMEMRAENSVKAPPLPRLTLTDEEQIEQEIRNRASEIIKKTWPIDEKKEREIESRIGHEVYNGKYNSKYFDKYMVAYIQQNDLRYKYEKEIAAAEMAQEMYTTELTVHQLISSFDPHYKYDKLFCKFASDYGRNYKKWRANAKRIEELKSQGKLHEFTIDYGTKKRTIVDGLEEAKQFADKDVPYTRLSILITDENNHLVSVREWNNGPAPEGDQEGIIKFGTAGYYSPWEDRE